MAKAWSWGEVTTGKKAKSTGGTGGGGGFVYSDMPYEIGEKKRVTIPYVRDAEGNLQMIIYSAPVHGIEDRGFIQLKGPRGNAYSPYSIRCMNPLSQISFDKGKEIADRKQYCALCTLASLQTAARFAKIDEVFGDIETFKATPKTDERKQALITQLNANDKVRASYNNQKKEVQYESYILVLELESSVKEVSTDFGIDKVTTVHLGENGLPKYKPMLMKASKARLGKFQKAYETAGKDGKITSASLHPFVDQTNTEVKTAFLDFELHFPSHDGGTELDKKGSAAKLEIKVTPSSDSVITEQFIEEVLNKSDFLIEKSEKAWVDGHQNLQDFTNDEYKNSMRDFGELFEQLKGQYLTERDIEHAQKVIETASTGKNMFKDETEGEATVEEVVPDVKPEKENTSTENVKVDSDLLNLNI